MNKIKNNNRSSKVCVCGETVLKNNIKTTKCSSSFDCISFNNSRSYNSNNNKLNLPFLKSSSSGFSLIELSIVLIIIGLLVAGITGGASLIQSAKIRNMINELREYKQVVYTFQAARGRYPGDVKDYGTFGESSNYASYSVTAKPYHKYESSDFSSDFMTEFQKTAGSGAVPDHFSAPFVELYTEGIIDFKPLGNVITSDKNDTKKGTPNLKSYSSAYIYYIYLGDWLPSTRCQKNDETCFFYTSLVNEGQIKEALMSTSLTEKFDPKILKFVDEKLDDGSFNTGVFRGGCQGSKGGGRNTYDNAIESGEKCTDIYYVL